jgi:hypothetical protein
MGRRPLRASIALMGIFAMVAAACGGPGPSASGIAEASASAPASDAGSGSAAAEPSGPLVPADGEIGAYEWAEVVVEELNLRPRPGTFPTDLPPLPAGTVGIVLGGPFESEGFPWYAFGAPGRAAVGCAGEDEPGAPSCEWFGYVAAADPGGEPYIERRDLQCPAPPSTVEDVAAAAPGVLMHCFGGETLRFDARVVSVPGRLCGAALDMTPRWLHPCTTHLVAPAVDDDVVIEVHLHPDLAGCDPDVPGTPPECAFVEHDGTLIELEGRFDDPAATSCSALGIDSATGMQPDPFWLVYQCRSAFVVTGVAPAD